uniref:Uncharacterized protein n=1 Tax=Cannabis sativa TaxID=3483 RepID=A0A803Q5X5_CANSA
MHPWAPPPDLGWWHPGVLALGVLHVVEEVPSWWVSVLVGQVGVGRCSWGSVPWHLFSQVTGRRCWRRSISIAMVIAVGQRLLVDPSFWAAWWRCWWASLSSHHFVFEVFGWLGSFSGGCFGFGVLFFFLFFQISVFPYGFLFRRPGSGAHWLLFSFRSVVDVEGGFGSYPKGCASLVLAPSPFRTAMGD